MIYELLYVNHLKHVFVFVDRLDYSFGTTKKRSLLNVNIEKNDTENIFTPSQSAEV